MAFNDVTWFGCDLVTGMIIEELPPMTGQLSRLLGAYTSSNLTMPIPLAPPDLPPREWRAATEPGRSMIVVEHRNRILWGGMVVGRSGGGPATVSLGCATLEAYFDRRYVPTRSYDNIDEALIAGDLADTTNVEGINFIIDAPETGTDRDRNYLDTDNKKVYTALRELMGVEGGPEFTVELEWNPEHNAVLKFVRIRNRIGHDLVRPEAWFETSTDSAADGTGGSETTYTFNEDFSESKGSNHVQAYSSDEENNPLISSPARNEAAFTAGWPRFEYRFQPSTTISDVTTLNTHARAARDLMKWGARVWSLQSRWSTYPILGDNWNLGDNVGWNVISHLHPDGVEGVARCIGWDLDYINDRVTPILLDLSEPEVV